MVKSILQTILSLGMLSGLMASTQGEDWTQFRGGASEARSNVSLPTKWGDDENLQWKIDLPGAGSSSPIVSGDHIFVTCFSGEPEGEEALMRHLSCIDRKTGNILWTRTVESQEKEERYQGMMKEHGFATNSPATDGKSVYAFFGKSGVVAFSMDGKKLWQSSVGTESGSKRWGSAASVVLHGNKVIVNASEESQSIRALDAATGKELWKAEGSALDSTYCTPAIAKNAQGQLELVAALPGEVWGLNPDTGKLNWYVETSLTGSMSPSVILENDTAYIFGGSRSAAGSMALKIGGKGDMTPSNILWTAKNSSYVVTPVLFQEHLYWIDDRGQAYCVNATDGNLVYRERVPDLSGSGRPVYASPVQAGDKIYALSRYSGMFVFPAAPKFELLQVNKFSDDDTDFNATPTIAGKQLLIRSDKRLYCVSETQK